MSTAPAPPRTLAVWILLTLLTVQAIGAIGGGIMLVADPDASLSQLPVEDLQGSPFDSFLVPGVILLVLPGMLPLAAAVGLSRRHAWAWWAAGIVGCSLVIWIVVEAQYIGFSWLQPGFGVVGVAIILACVPGSVRRYCGIVAATA